MKFFTNNKDESKDNNKTDIKKIIIGVFLGSAIVGAGGFSLTNKGKKFWKNVGKNIKSKSKDLKAFFGVGVDEMIKSIKKLLSNKK